MRNGILCILFLLGFVLNGTAQSNWTLYKKDNNYTIWLKDVPNEKIKQFKLQSNIKGDCGAVQRILKDVENMHLWYDKVKSVTLLKKINDYEAIYLLEYDLPFPFEDRIATIKGSLEYNNTSDIIKVKTTFYPYEVPKDKKDYLIISKIASSWEIKKLPDNSISILHSGYLDPEGNIPAWLVNEGITSGPIKTLEGLKRRLKAY